MTLLPSSSHSHLRASPRILGVILLLVVLGLLAGCAEITGMEVQPRYDPLEAADIFPDGRSARALVPGTVPQTETRVDDPVVTGLDTNGEPLAGFPVDVTAELVAEGQEQFAVYCTPCHGDDAQGEGRAVAFGFPQPPNLLDETYRTMPNGQIFDVITNGSGIMFPYGYRVKAPERWAVIAYLRAMQLKGGPLTEELTPEELNQLGAQP